MHGISVVVTVRNDREGLVELLPGLAAQTLKPDEILIVDGGSIDGTLQALDDFSLPGTAIRTEIVAGANIAAGRNAGVRLARHELIACTDAGCRPDPGWLAALEAALDEADIASGVFVAEGKTEFERIVALTHYPVVEELGQTAALTRLSHRLFGRRFVASPGNGRSIAFHRRVWETVDGFPERQYTGEDLAFARAAADRGFRAALVEDAVVRWRPRGTWAANARMFFRYCRGDIRSKGRWRHFVRLLAWTLGPFGLVRGGWHTRASVISGAAGYIGLPVRRARIEGFTVRSMWRIPLAVAVKDLAQLAGAFAGLLDAARGVPQPTPHPPSPLSGSSLDQSAITQK